MATEETPEARILKWVDMAQKNRIALSDQLDELDSKRRELQNQIEAVEKLLNSLFPVLETLKNLPVASAIMEAEPTPPGETHFERIENFFKMRENTPSSITEIEKGTGIPKTSLTAVLYRTHEEEFFRFPAVPGKMLQTWKLKKYATPEPPIPPTRDPSDDIPF